MTGPDSGNSPRRDELTQSVSGSEPARLDSALQRAIMGYAATPDSPLPGVDIELRRRSLERAFTFKPAEHIDSLESEFPEAFNAMATLGAHPLREVQLHNYYTNRPSKDRFQNIGEHCVAATLVAQALGRDLLSSGALKSLCETSLTDPLSKVGEALRREAAREGAYEEGKIYLPEAYAEERDLLEARGIDARIASRIVTKDVVTGHRSFASFLSLDAEGKPQVVVDESGLKRAILHLADDMLYSTLPAIARTYSEQPVTAVIEPVERMFARMFHSTEKIDGKEIGYPWMWKDGLGVGPDRRIVRDVNQERPQPGVRAIGHYAYFQRFIAEQIGEALIERLHQKGVLVRDKSTTPLEQLRDYVIAGISHPER